MHKSSRKENLFLNKCSNEATYCSRKSHAHLGFGNFFLGSHALLPRHNPNNPNIYNVYENLWNTDVPVHFQSVQNKMNYSTF